MVNLHSILFGTTVLDNRTFLSDSFYGNNENLRVGLYKILLQPHIRPDLSCALSWYAVFSRDFIKESRSQCLASPVCRGIVEPIADRKNGRDQGTGIGFGTQ